MDEQSDKAAFDYEFDTADPGKGLWILISVVGAIIAAFIFLRTEPSHIQNEDALALLLNNGQPKVLEFYSNY